MNQQNLEFSQPYRPENGAGVNGLNFGLSAVVNALSTPLSGADWMIYRNRQNHALPSRAVVIECVEALRSVLFPGYFGIADITPENLRFHIGVTLDRVLRLLQQQVQNGLCFECRSPTDERHCPDCEQHALEITKLYLDRLPVIQTILASDVRAAFEGDPSARSISDAIFCYPGILAVTNYRLAHELHKLGVPLLPRIITEHAHSITGIDIHPGAKIGHSFFIDHGTGVVIGETAVLGNRVRLYQGVTLGAKNFPQDDQGILVKGLARHPILEDDVVVYAGATILGRVTIGEGSSIGGNVWLTHSVNPGSWISQAKTRADGFVNGDGI
jgi:serine O-acetyltransferase